MANNIPAWTLWIPFLSAIFGSAVTGFANFFINRTNKKSEEHKHTKELLFKAAIDEWKITSEAVKEYAKSNKRTVLMGPLDEYLAGMFIFHNLILDTKLNHEDIKNKLEEYSKITEEIHLHFKEKSNIEQYK